MATKKEQQTFGVGLEGLIAKSEANLPQEEFIEASSLPSGRPQLPLGSEGTVFAESNLPAPPPEESAPPLWDRFSDAVNANNLAFNAVDLAMGKPDFAPTPGFNAGDFPTAFDGTPAEYHDELTDSSSLEEMLFKKQQIGEEVARTERIMSGGTGVGMALMLAGSVDPTLVIGMAAEVRVANKMLEASRLARVTTGAATGAVIAAAETAVVAEAQETVGASDIAVASMLVGGLGAVAGALSRSHPGQKDLAKLAGEVEKLEQAHVTSAKTVLDDPTRAVAEPATLDGETVNIFGATSFDDLKKAGKLTPETIASLEDKTVPLTGQMRDLYLEAARRDKEGSIISLDAFHKSKVGQALAKNPAMSDAVAILKTKGPVARLLATELLENASGVGGRLVNKTASMMAEKDSRILLQTWMPEMRLSYTRWAKQNKINPVTNLFQGKGQKQFMDELRLEMEGRRVFAETGHRPVGQASEHIKSAADALDMANKRTIDMLQAAGVRGADELKYVPGYIPLKLSSSALARADRAGTLGSYKALLAKSYKSVGIDADDADRIAQAVVSRSMAKSIGMDANPARMLSKDSRAFLETIMRESNMAEADVKSMMARIDGNKADQGKTKALRSRVTVDLTYRDNGLALMDIVDNDIPTLMSRNSREMAGRSALARKGIKDEGDWLQARAAVARELSQLEETSVAEKAMKSLDAIYDDFMGKPIGTGVHKNVRRLMEWTTNARLGQVGFAQFAESANVVAHHGLLNTLAHIPAVLRIHRQLRLAAKTGDYSKVDPLMEELRVFGGQMWDEHLLNRPEIRLNDALSDDPSWLEGTMSALDRVQASANDKLGFISGLYKIKAMQQQATVLMQTEKVVNFLKAGGKGRETVLNRFADLGWNEKTLAKIEKNLKHVEFMKDGKTLNKLNLEKWDAATREDFVVGLQRHAHQVIQLPMIGEKAAWQSSNIGALFAQFKTFSLTAIEKQAGRNYKSFDGETLATLTYGSAFSALATYAKVYTNSIGKPDREKYLKERTTYSAIAASMVNYSGIHGPATDIFTNAYALGLSPFQVSPNARGGGVKGLESFVPAAQTATDLVNVATIPARKLLPWHMLTGDKNKEFLNLKEADVKNTVGVMPWGSSVPMMLISNGLQSAVKD